MDVTVGFLDSSVGNSPGFHAVWGPRTCPRSGGTAAATNGYGNSGGNRDAGLQKREAIVCCHGNLRVPPYATPQEIRPY